VEGVKEEKESEPAPGNFRINLLRPFRGRASSVTLTAPPPPAPPVEKAPEPPVEEQRGAAGAPREVEYPPSTKRPAPPQPAAERVVPPSPAPPREVRERAPTGEHGRGGKGAPVPPPVPAEKRERTPPERAQQSPPQKIAPAKAPFEPRANNQSQGVEKRAAKEPTPPPRSTSNGGAKSGPPSPANTGGKLVLQGSSRDQITTKKKMGHP
jgi:hypothetical protein